MKGGVFFSRASFKLQKPLVQTLWRSPRAFGSQNAFINRVGSGSHDYHMNGVMRIRQHERIVCLIKTSNDGTNVGLKLCHSFKYWFKSGRWCFVYLVDIIWYGIQLRTAGRVSLHTCKIFQNHSLPTRQVVHGFNELVNCWLTTWQTDD